MYASSTRARFATSDLDTWGYGVIGGVTFNLPMLSAGSKIAFQGAYAHGAIAYSGAGSPAWGEQDQGFNTNGNGTLFPMADAIYTGGCTLGAVERLVAAAQLTWKVSPQFEIDPEIAYASVDYGAIGAIPGAFAFAEGDSLVGRRRVRLVAGQEPRFRPRRGLRVVASVDTAWLGHRHQRTVPQELGRLQRPPARRPLVLIERADWLQTSAPERKLRGLFCFQRTQARR